VNSSPPARPISDDSAPNQRANARFIVALLSVAALATAVWLAVNADDGTLAETRIQLLLAPAALVLFLIAIVCYLAAAGVAGRGQAGDRDGDHAARTIRSIRFRSAWGAAFALAAVLTVAGLGALWVVMPPADRPVAVQFSDIGGRVQLEYCPSLPGSFDALVKPADLAGSSTLLPVWVTSRVCGNPSFQNGVWLYLDRSTVTVADAGQR